MFTFLLIVQTLVAASLVGVILMQRSEGGGLGVGGSSSGLMSARGAADFLTRSTAILGALFVILSIALAAIAGVSQRSATVDTSLANQAAPAPASMDPLSGQPPAGVTGNEAAAALNGAAPAQPAPVQNDSDAVPLAQ